VPQKRRQDPALPAEGLYFANATRVIAPVVLISVAFLFFAIMSSRRLRHLEDLRPAALQRTQFPFVKQAEEEIQARNARRYEAERSFLQTAPKPRAVQFKASAQIFSIAFPASWIIFGYWAYQITRAPLTVKTFSDNVAPFLFFAVIWSFICIGTISEAHKDRHLLANGDVAVATITSQELVGGRQKRSEITYNFRDRSGRIHFGKATDDSRTLYEEMQTPVFYDPQKTQKNVLLVTASCELKDYWP
jgi:hypothetical protein